MRKLLFISLLLMAGSASAQSRAQIKRLARVAKVWGFLKYYHPAAASGKVDWDAELPKLLAMTAGPARGLNTKLEAWYHTLPEANLSATPGQPGGDSVKRIFGKGDIRRFGSGKMLEKTFIALFRYHLPDSSVFVTNRYKQYTLDYLLNMEDSFTKHAFRSRDMRMLSLFRYWNVINYQYPHKSLIPASWDRILTRYIPVFWQAGSEAAYLMAVRRLIAELEDSHAFFQEEAYNRNQLLRTSFELFKKNRRYFVTRLSSPALADREGIMQGDEIIRINGIGVKAYTRKKLADVNGTNRLSRYRNEAAQLFKADTATRYLVDVRRKGQVRQISIQRYPLTALVPPPPTPLWKPAGEGVWYVNFCAINHEADLKKMLETISGATAVIMDMRGYPSYALLAQAFASFMPDSLYLGENQNARADFPGTFHRNADRYRPEVAKYPVYRGKMIVMVNEQTQSLAESVSAQLSLRPNTTVVGSQTAGTTGNVNYLALPGQIRVSFTSVGYQGAENSFVQKRGVKIGHRVNIRVKDLQTGRDRIYEKAINLLKIK